MLNWFRRESGQGNTIPDTLRKLSKQLGRPLDLHQSIEKQIVFFDGKDKAEEALLDFCEAQPKIRSVMIEFQKSRADLKELYDWIIEHYGGQWQSGHWVPASSLAYPETLRYIFTRKGQDDSTTVLSLLEYFESGEPFKME